MSVCNDCKYYYRTDQYCTRYWCKNNPNKSPCEDFELGVFNDRFYVKAEGYSLGEYYILVDLERELVDSKGEFLDFRYSFEAETLCVFLNKQYHRLHNLQLWVNEKYYVNKIEEEYWEKHNNKMV